IFLFFLSLFFLSQLQAQSRNFNFFEAQKLKAKKEAFLKGDAEVKALVNLIFKDADSYLADEPQSITQKNFTPHSGSKNDYMSMGPYWWPDETKADGLPYIRKDG